MKPGEKDRTLPLALLLFALLVFYGGCGRDVELLKETSREPNASLRFADFRHTLYRGTGKERWNVHGKEAFIYQKNDEVQRIVAYGFSMKQFDTADAMEITAKKGDMDYSKKVIQVEGDVLLKDSKGSIQGQRMTYDLEKKIARSSDPVVIDRKGMRANCTGGMIFDRGSDRMTCLSPVGTVQEMPGSETGKNEKKNSKAEDLFQ